MRLLRAVIVVLLVPTATAAPPACSAVTEQPSNVLGLYVVLAPPANSELWAESNGVSGLQRRSCTLEDGITVVGADTPLLEVTS